ncbi:MAG: DUF2975 domain-containing protein [Bacteroidales bacterium]|nr:DUF2975 domain-containing protein [Clostridium sp.]MCM1203664.1 DUF2975 domain-containing protein [Bacteroidales bacterium]
MNTNFLSKFTKFFLDFMFYCGILVTLSVPVTFKVLGVYYPNIGSNYLVMCIIFMLCGLLALWIIYHLRRIFQTVIEENCFVEENVTSLKRMGGASFLISLVTLVRLFFVVTPASLIIILVFFIAGLFSLVLAQVFAQAVSYKQENDFTI